MMFIFLRPAEKPVTEINTTNVFSQFVSSAILFFNLINLNVLFMLFFQCYVLTPRYDSYNYIDMNHVLESFERKSSKILH